MNQKLSFVPYSREHKTIVVHKLFSRKINKHRMPCIFRLSFLSSFLLRLPSVRTCTSSPRALASESGGGASDAHARRDGSPLFARGRVHAAARGPHAARSEVPRDSYFFRLVILLHGRLSIPLH